MMKELEERKNELSDELISTVYFGGGTPSVLSVQEISGMLYQINRCYKLDENAEITLECNPDDVTPEFLKGIRENGINRLSMGIQSFSPADLQLMNRRHTAKQAVDAVHMAQKAGFDNISIDLIYGLPGQDMEAWMKNIEQAIQLDVQHISAYDLTYHEGTVFYEKLEKGILSELPDEFNFQQFHVLRKKLADAGFEQYEISNFARNQLYSKHNTAYWFQKKYLGIGPSAHSFDQKTRRWNVSDNRKYMEGIEEGTKYFEFEQLSASDCYNDYIITRLRTIWGIDENEIGEDYRFHFRRNIEKYISSGHVLNKKGAWVLSEDGLFISDKIMEDLIFVHS